MGSPQKGEVWGQGGGPSAKTARIQEVDFVPLEFEAPVGQIVVIKSKE